jgi:GNAT superfamily N-acetyltransferase
MEIVALDLADDETVAACHAVREDAARADDPFASPVSATAFRSRLSSGWTGGPCESWYVPGGDGTVAGWYRAEFPDMENLGRADVQLVVHPARRRDGLGTALLRHAADCATASGREILSGLVQEGSSGEAFALRAGAALGMADVRRVQELAKIPADAITQLRETTAGAASGYSLVRWTGVIPEERIDQVVALHEAMNDSPRDAAVEPTTWTAERVRGRMNTRFARSPVRRYWLAAMHDGTGEMAALTAVGVDPDVPDWGQQAVTAVTRPHRGHRLGLLVKTAMLEWLFETEPRLKHIETWNAGSNQHMIAINEQLGYTVRGHFRSADLQVASFAR